MSTRMAVAALTVVALALPAMAQAPAAPPLRPVRVVVASGRLPSVIDAPMHMRLLRVTLAAGQTSAYAGAHGMLYVVSGTLDATLDGDRRSLKDGGAIFIPAGHRATLSAGTGAPVVALHFLLGSAADFDQPGHARPAAVAELHRSAEPLPNLKPGVYEFTMSRVTVQKGTPPPPRHHRSGAALYYVAAGSWTIHMEPGTEPRARGNVQLEPNGFLHTWELVGDAPGVLLQANISPEGTPEIIFVPSP